ncbi:MAG: cupin domain-containing protein [Steroidobacteraceae bacterium]
MTRPIHSLAVPAILFAVLGAIGVVNAETPVAPGLDRPLAVAEAATDLQWGDCPAIFPSGCKISVLHGNPAEPGADVFLRVPSGYTIPAHSHTSAERMVLVSGQLDVTYAGHPTVSLKPGDYAYGPAMLAHTARCNGAEACTLFIAFNSAVDALPFEGTN